MAAGVLVLGFRPADAVAQADAVKRLQVDQTIEPQGANPFGEQVNPYTGELTFRHEDVVFEGNGPAIRLVRYGRSVNNGFNVVPMPVNAFKNWSLSIPVLHAVVDAAGWAVGPESDPNRYKRCSHFQKPMYFGNLSDPDGSYEGMNLETDAGDTQRLIKRAAGNTAFPAMSDGQGDPILFPAMTKENWQIGCLDATSNGETGEAFLAVSPEGGKYYLDRLVYSPPWEVVEPDPDPLNPRPLRQNYRLATFFVTRVEDRFGNYLTYHYTDGAPTSITASDGREVALNWSGGWLASIVQQPGSADQRTWAYVYDGGYLKDVVLPDGSKWSLSANAGQFYSLFVLPYDFRQCGIRSRSNTANSTTTTLVAPSGLVGTFVRSNLWHARNYVPSQCYTPPGFESEAYEIVPPFFNNVSLVKKTYSGPGIAAQVWTYEYQPATGTTTEDACAASSACPETKWVDVTDPAGNRKRFVYGNRYGQTEGELRQTLTYQGNSTLLATETFQYATPGEGWYPCTVGAASNTGCQSWTDGASSDVWRPVKSIVRSQQGTNFTWRVESDCNGRLCFDEFARPTKVTRSSAPAP